MTQLNTNQIKALQLKINHLQRGARFFLPKVIFSIIVIWVLCGLVAPSIDNKGTGVEFVFITLFVLAEINAIHSVLFDIVKALESLSEE